MAGKQDSNNNNQGGGDGDRFHPYHSNRRARTLQAQQNPVPQGDNGAIPVQGAEGNPVPSVNIPAASQGGSRGPRELNFVVKVDSKATVDKINVAIDFDSASPAPGGGQQTSITGWKELASGGISATIKRAEDASVIAKSAFDKPGATEVEITAIPVNRRRWVANRRMRGNQVISLGSGLIMGPPKPLKERTTEKPSAQEAQEEDIEMGDEDSPCVLCQSKDHQLLECMKCDANGYMRGCPVCNTLSHNVKDCRKFATVPDRDKVDWLVAKRGNMPPFPSRPSWFNLVVKNVAAGRRIPRCFPWTAKFAASMDYETRVKTLQQEFDDHYDRSLLSSDPATRTWDQTQRTFQSNGPINADRLSTLRQGRPDRIGLKPEAVTARDAKVQGFPDSLRQLTMGAMQGELSEVSTRKDAQISKLQERVRATELAQETTEARARVLNNEVDRLRKRQAALEEFLGSDRGDFIPAQRPIREFPNPTPQSTRIPVQTSSSDPTLESNVVERSRLSKVFLSLSQTCRHLHILPDDVLDERSFDPEQVAPEILLSILRSDEEVGRNIGRFLETAPLGEWHCLDCVFAKGPGSRPNRSKSCKLHLGSLYARVVEHNDRRYFDIQR